MGTIDHPTVEPQHVAFHVVDEQVDNPLGPGDLLRRWRERLIYWEDLIEVNRELAREPIDGGHRCFGPQAFDVMESGKHRIDCSDVCRRGGEESKIACQPKWRSQSATICFARRACTDQCR